MAGEALQAKETIVAHWCRTGRLCAAVRPNDNLMHCSTIRVKLLQSSLEFTPQAGRLDPEIEMILLESAPFVVVHHTCKYAFKNLKCGVRSTINPRIIDLKLR